ncbi:hypothetical protein BOCO_0664 [Bombiscardovia coagulans]|uniref:Uncharacterized protein n=1 Tax=Bombiscardovia coagulans TaxID=686666 RepID=A0A261ETG9_9BIFI|nr:hypothetical protein BOCO_0664 [Bombiscardovia coagulans]
MFLDGQGWQDSPLGLGDDSQAPDYVNQNASCPVKTTEFSLAHAGMMLEILWGKLLWQIK